jgi:hypothetical protein
LHSFEGRSSFSLASFFCFARKSYLSRPLMNNAG